MRANWNYPTSVRAGGELTEACAEFGMRAPLLVTDPGLAQLSMATNMVADCARRAL